MGLVSLTVGLLPSILSALFIPAPRTSLPMTKLTLAEAIQRAKNALTMSNLDLANALGAGRKTVGKWTMGRGSPAPAAIDALATLLLPVNAGLALELVRAHNAALSHGSPYILPETPYLPPAPPPAPAPAPAPAPPVATPADLVDAMVCAACEAADVAPKAMRAALAAAFTRAQRLGLDVAQVVTVLVPPKAKK